MKSRGQAGVTLLEAIIAVAIMGLIVSGVTRQLAVSDRHSKDMYAKLVARQVMDRTLAQVIGTGTFFPPVGGGIVYLGCYDAQSVMTKNQSGTSEFLGLAIADPAQPSHLCPGAKFEAHVVPSTVVRKTAVVYVFTIDQKTGDSRQQFVTKIDVEPSL